MKKERKRKSGSSYEPTKTMGKETEKERLLLMPLLIANAQSENQK